ncbi:MAG: EAL domain-containing protein [Candidatus Dormibacteraeota bacterium]|nr:EAL domain-containing protein [Candidatus Dormibacteraeota bacterium]
MPTLSLPDGGPAHSQSRAQWRLSGRQLSRLAWAGTLIAAGVLWAAVVWKLPEHAQPHVPWWLLVPAFLATELWPVRLHMRAEWASPRLWATPLMVGLFYSTPLDLLVAFALAAAVAAGIRSPRRPVAIVSAAARAAVAVAIAFLVFTIASPLGIAEWEGWLAAVLAVAAATAVDLTTGVTAPLTKLRRTRRGSRPSLLAHIAASCTSICLGIVATGLIPSNALALLPLGLLAAGLLWAYRGYMAERQQRLALEFLSGAGDALGGPELGDAMVQLLRRAQGMFRAELAQLTIFPSAPGEKAFRTTVRVGEPDQVMEPLDLTRLDDVLEADSDGLIIDRAGSSPLASDMLARRGIDEAMVALLRGERRILGSLIVGGHQDLRAYDSSDLHLFRTLAVQTSTTLENGRMERSVARLTELQEQLTHQAYHDSLTNLANRTLFSDRIENALVRSGRTGRSVAVLFIDVDEFKGINDTFGHATGDALLVGIADRLRSTLRRPDTPARLGGDEFAVLLEDLEEPAEAESVARRIFEAMRAPFEVNGQSVTVHVSMGVAIARGAGNNASNLMRHADVAMYSAKGQGKDRWGVFAPGMETDIVTRHRLRGGLGTARAQDQFTLHYQPVVELATGDIVGVEALVRWRHPTRGLVGPLEFVPMAEESGLILQLGDHVLRRACAALLRFQARHPRTSPLSVAVNISARQLAQPLFVENVRAIIAESGLRPHTVTLELTESILLDDASTSIVKLEALQRAGIRIAVDDFGTGYSSLSYLRQLPVDVLKIAKPFVDDLASEQPNVDFVRAIVGLASALRLGVVAEGIETAEQLRWLRTLGCELGQGYHLSHPLPFEEMEALLQQGGLGPVKVDAGAPPQEQVLQLRAR